MADYKVGIVIGAALAGGYRSTVGSAKSELDTLGKAIKDLSAQRGLIEQFEKDQAAVEKARLAFSAAQKEVMRLKLELKKGTGDATAKDLEKAQAKAEKLNAALEKTREKIRKTEQAMDKAGVETSDFANHYTKLGVTLDQTRLKYEKLESRMAAKSAAGQKLSEMKGQMIGLAGAAYAAGKVIGQAMDFESSMADVRKVVDFKEPDGLVKMGSSLKEMSKTIPIGATGLAQIAASGGQLGVAEKDLTTFTGIVAKMSTAFDMLPDEAGDSMAKLSNVYQIPINKMTILGDAINHLADNTSAKSNEMVNAMARVGGTTRLFGLTAIQAAALEGAFLSLGRSPELAATATNALLTKLQTATRQGGKFKDALDEIGVSAVDLEANIAVNGQEALVGFLQKLEKINPKDRAGKIVDLFGTEYSDDINLLIGGLNEYRKSLSLVSDESKYAGSMTREFENQSATTKNQLILLGNAVSVAAINLGSIFLPGIVAVVKPMATLTGWIGTLVEKAPGVATAIVGAAAGLGILKVGLIAVTAATWLWKAAMVAASDNPIGLLIQLLAVGAGIIIANWRPITQFFGDVWAGIKTVFKEGIAWITKIWDEGPVGKMLEIGGKIGAWVGKKVSGAGKALGTAALGASLVAAPAAAGMPDMAAKVNEMKPAVSSSASSTQINAPITINAAPGMNEKEVARHVVTELDKRESQAKARQRGALHD